jgi:hypothetical protein
MVYCFLNKHLYEVFRKQQFKKMENLTKAPPATRLFRYSLDKFLAKDMKPRILESASFYERNE